MKFNLQLMLKKFLRQNMFDLIKIIPLLRKNIRRFANMLLFIASDFDVSMNMCSHDFTFFKLLISSMPGIIDEYLNISFVVEIEKLENPF